MRFGISLPHPVLRRLREFALAKGHKPGAIIEHLVARHLAGGGGPDTESAPRGQLDRLIDVLNDAHEERERGEQELLRAVEVLSLAVRDANERRERDHLELQRAVEVLSLAMRELLYLWFVVKEPALDALTAESLKNRLEHARSSYALIAQRIATSHRDGQRLVRDLPREDGRQAAASAGREPKKDGRR